MKFTPTQILLIEELEAFQLVYYRHYKGDAEIDQRFQFIKDARGSELLDEKEEEIVFWAAAFLFSCCFEGCDNEAIACRTLDQRGWMTGLSPQEIEKVREIIHSNKCPDDHKNDKLCCAFQEDVQNLTRLADEEKSAKSQSFEQ